VIVATSASGRGTSDGRFGDPTSSAEDVALTAELAQVGTLLDIDLLDHFIIS